MYGKGYQDDLPQKVVGDHEVDSVTLWGRSVCLLLLTAFGTTLTNRLMIHPDKVSHPKARDAFDLLKKAETDLMDPGKRSFLNGIIDEAKFEVKKAQPLNMAPTDPFFTSPVYKSLVKQKTKDLLIESELRKRKLIRKEMEAEGEVARKQDEVISERKRKQEAQKVWEDSRDDRVQGWRNFQAGKTAGGKMKKKKPSTFRPPKAVAENATPYSKRPTTSSASEGF